MSEHDAGERQDIAFGSQQGTSDERDSDSSQEPAIEHSGLNRDSAYICTHSSNESSQVKILQLSPALLATVSIKS